MINLILLGISLLTSKEPHQSVQISQGYFSGKYLIYDCGRKNFACVDEFGFLDCLTAREHSIKILDLNLPCAPLKKFDQFDECETAQYQEIESPKHKPFCLLNSYEISHPF